MTSDAILVLAWLVLAHLVGDFVVQTNRMVADKRSSGRRAWRGLLAHGAAVAVCLVPVVAVYAGPGLVALAVVAISHVAIDRWKVLATRHAEARALVSAHRRHEPTDTPPPDSLGPAWTPVPGALFVVDQLLHLAIIAGVWVWLVFEAAPTPEWNALVDRVVGGFDRAELHRWAMLASVGASLVIVNVRAGALFVATLVQPRAAVSGDPLATDPPVTVTPALPARWTFRVGPVVATADPAAAHSPAPDRPREAHASPARIGATIGILERLLIVTFVLTGSLAAIGFVIAAKTLARFKQLDDRDFAEYYLLGTLASVAVALGSALLAQAALGSLAPVG